MHPSALLAVLSVLAGQAQHPATQGVALISGPTHSTPSNDTSELMLMDVMYQHLRLDTSTPAFQNPDGHRFLPLRQISNALGFRLRVYPARKFAAGFLTAPSDTFEIDGAEGFYKRKGVVTRFDHNLCYEREGELYVESGLLERAAGLHFTWKLTRLEIDVESDIPLTVKQQWIERHQLIVGEQPHLNTDGMGVLKVPYKAWSPPAVNVQAYSATDSSREADQRTSQLALDGVGDFLYMTGHYRLTTDADRKPTALFSLGREDLHSNLAGPMHASQFSFGDLSLPPIALLDKSRVGLGATISNYPISGSDTSGGEQIEGHATPNSIIELYRGDLLLSEVLANADGRYAFSNIPLESGRNDLKVVVVGPEGEVREEQRTLYGDAQGPAKGKGRYRATIGQVGKTMLGADSLEGASSQNRKELIGEVQYGLSPISWISGTLAGTSSSSGNHNFAGLGFHSWGGGMLWHVQSMAASSGGTAVSVGASKKVGNAMVSVERTKAGKGFDPTLLPEIGVDANAVTSVRVDGVTGHKERQVSYGLGVDKLEGANDSTLIRGRVSGKLASMFVSNTTTARLTGGPFDASGLLQFRKSLGNSVGRLELGYGLGTNRPLQTGLASIDHKISANYSMRYGMDYDVTRSQAFGPVGTLYRSLGPLSLGLNAGTGERGGMKFSILLSTAIGADDSLHHLALAAPGLADMGAIDVRVFLDKNLSGKYDLGDELLPNIGLLVSGHPTAARTDSKGACVLDHLQPNQEVRVTLNDETLDNPNWVPETPGVIASPRPGRKVRYDFGVIETAEVEGRPDPLSRLAAYPGLTAELVDVKGKVVDTSIIDINGTYVFSRVHPGNYTIRLTALQNLKIGERPIKITPGELVKDFDIKLDPGK